MQTIEARIQVGSDSPAERLRQHTLSVQLPADVPMGEYEVVLVLNQRSASAVDEAIHKNKTVGDHVPPDSITGKGKALGDIISPIVSEEDWECLK